MASPGNRHCASCIGTLSFPICAPLLLLLGSGAVDRYLLPADCTASNPPVQRGAPE